jgi:hypothetical protein
MAHYEAVVFFHLVEEIRGCYLCQPSLRHSAHSPPLFFPHLASFFYPEDVLAC